VTLDALGNIGDFVGGVGVVITLIYLATQIRQNTATVRASGAASHNEGLNNITLLLAQNDQARTVYYQGLSDYASLSEDGVLQFDLLLQYFCQSIQRSQHLYRERALTEEAWRETEAALTFLSSQSGFHSMWEKWGSAYPPEFRKLVEKFLTSTRTSDAPAA